MKWEHNDHKMKSKQVIRLIDEFADLPISTDVPSYSAIPAGTLSTDTKSASVRVNG